MDTFGILSFNFNLESRTRSPYESGPELSDRLKALSKAWTASVGHLERTADHGHLTCPQSWLGVRNGDCLDSFPASDTTVHALVSEQNGLARRASGWSRILTNVPEPPRSPMT